MNVGVEWTPEDIQELRKLKEKGLTAAQIAKLIPRSRHSIISRARRCGFNVKPGKGMHRAVERPRKPSAEELWRRALAGRCFPRGLPNDPRHSPEKGPETVCYLPTMVKHQSGQADERSPL